MGRWADGVRKPGSLYTGQVSGGMAGSGVLYVIAIGQPGFDLSAGFAADG